MENQVIKNPPSQFNGKFLFFFKPALQIPEFFGENKFQIIFCNCLLEGFLYLNFFVFFLDKFFLNLRITNLIKKK